MDTLTLVTWNLLGSQGVDIGLVAEVIGDVSPDAVALQEVQRTQSQGLAERLGWSVRWAFKHWPVRTRSEGMAVLTPHVLGDVSPFVVQPAAPWSWRRRIAIDATVVREGRPWRVINVHLSPHDAHGLRSDETNRVLERSSMAAPIIAGDLNERPGGPAAELLHTAGWRDAWASAHPG
ncbi:MAG: endonuclease/exonuclease/phosphatase family protein, partial [Desertimonas sp.]